MEIDFTIKRSRRKTVALEVTRHLEVIVRAPLNISQREINHFVMQHKSWITGKLDTQRKKKEAMPEPTDAEINELIQKARMILPQRVTYYGALMGVMPTGVKITSAKTRFGSCSGKNSICFSWRLMRYPDDAVDYVVVHELAHILNKNHGKSFYECVASVLPDYKMRRKLLKD